MVCHDNQTGESQSAQCFPGPFCFQGIYRLFSPLIAQNVAAHNVAVMKGQRRKKRKNKK